MVEEYIIAIFHVWWGLMGTALATVAGMIAAYFSLRSGRDSNRTLLWIMFGVGLFCLFVIAPYSLWKQQRKQLASVSGEYAYALSAVGANTYIYGGGKSGVVRIDFRNSISRPIEFDVERAVIDGVEQYSFASRRQYIGAHGTASYLTPLIRFANVGANGSYFNSIYLDLHYGAPGRLSRNFILDVEVGDQMVRNIKDPEDEPLSTSGD